MLSQLPAAPEGLAHYRGTDKYNAGHFRVFHKGWSTNNALIVAVVLLVFLLFAFRCNLTLV